MNSKGDGIHGISMTPYKKTSKENFLEPKPKRIQVGYLQSRTVKSEVASLVILAITQHLAPQKQFSVA